MSLRSLVTVNAVCLMFSDDIQPKDLFWDNLFGTYPDCTYLEC
jgi:hypothetical protein